VDVDVVEAASPASSLRTVALRVERVAPSPLVSLGMYQPVSVERPRTHPGRPKNYVCRPECGDAGAVRTDAGWHSG
jgi:hypothetical protein